MSAESGERAVGWWGAVCDAVGVLDADNWISLAGLSVTVVIAWAACVQIAHSRRALQASHTPNVTTTLIFNETVGSLKIHNNGLGPAFLESIEVLVDGERLQGPYTRACKEVLIMLRNDWGLTCEPSMTYTFQRHFPLRAGADMELMRLKITSVDQDLVRKKGNEDFDFTKYLFERNVQIKVTYLDMFKVLHTHVGPDPALEL